MASEDDTTDEIINFNGILIGTGSVAPIGEDVHEFLTSQNLQDKGYQLNFNKCLKRFCGGEILYSPGDFVLLEQNDDEVNIVQVESFFMIPCRSGIEPSMIRCKLFDAIPEEQQHPIETGKVELQETTLTTITVTGHLIRKLLSFDCGHGRFSLVDHLGSMSLYKDVFLNVPCYPFEGDFVTLHDNMHGEVIHVDAELRTCVVKINDTGCEVNCDWDDISFCD